MLMNKKSLGLLIIGYLVTALIIYVFLNRPLLIFFVSLIVFPYAFINTQVKRDHMIQGTIATYFSVVLMGLLTLWVYQFFKWPPDLVKVFTLNAQVLATFETLYTASHYLLNRHELSNFLHSEVFLAKCLKILISILAPLAAIKVINYSTASIITVFGLILLWAKIVYEISGIYQ